MSSEFEKRTREILDDSAGRLDGRTRSRLTQARHRALAQMQEPARGAWRIFAPLSAGVAAAALAVVFWMARSPDRAPPMASAGAAFEDIDLLSDAEAPDFVSDAEDLEFYEWAAGEVES
jgi:hypothetical protein